jgi:hypothetical protein
MTADVNLAAMVGGVASVMTIVISKWFDSGAQERRTLTENRREDDRAKAIELADCEKSRDDMRVRCSQLWAENAVLKATLIAHNITLPPSFGEPT